jgi:hypothetical protein
MKKVSRDEILDYQTYSDQRDAIRPAVLDQKRDRRVHVGPYLTFLFENADTVRYQVQEMMRIEQLVREGDIQHELDTYNELIGDDGELGCVLLIEIETPEERAVKLVAWRQLPHHLYAEAEDGTKAYATFDERQMGDDRLSSVQYLKFDTKGQVPLRIGSDLPELPIAVDLTDSQRDALRTDLGN